MTAMTGARSAWRMARAGHLRARVRATREAESAVRVALTGAALATGVLDALAGEPATSEELARRTGAANPALLAAFLRVLAAAGLVTGAGDRWRVAARGREVLTDDFVRASYEAFSGFHTGLYRDLPGQLAGGPARRDVAEQGGLIARVSTAFDPFVDGFLTALVRERAPRRFLDAGCGAGLQLAAVLAAAPGVEGVGLDLDADAVALARRTLTGRGLGRRARVLQDDVRTATADALGGPFDLALLANAVYYVPVGRRVAVLSGIAGLLAPGGALAVVTTAATPALTSRHFDLLLRAQEGAMELPDAEVLRDQLAAAGLTPGPVRSLAPGMPLVAVVATCPG
jgi:SAM-dependent methyltransferase